MNEETFLDKQASVRGGIPILFPNAGAIDSLELPKLKQNGFARNSENWIIEFSKDNFGFAESLSADQDTMDLYPYNFKLLISGKFEEDRSFTLIQQIFNLEDSKSIPISSGFHPYFKVPDSQKKQIKFNFNGGRIIEEKFETWANGMAISIDNPKVKDGGALMEVVVPGTGKLIVDAAVEYKRIWIWSQPGKDFICIEPFVRDAGGIVTDPVMIKAKESFSARFNIDLARQ